MHSHHQSAQGSPSCISLPSSLLHIPPPLHQLSAHLIMVTEKDKQQSMHIKRVFTHKQHHLFYKYLYTSKNLHQFSHFMNKVIEDQRSEVTCPWSQEGISHLVLPLFFNKVFGHFPKRKYTYTHILKFLKEIKLITLVH